MANTNIIGLPIAIASFAVGELYKNKKEENLNIEIERLNESFDNLKPDDNYYVNISENDKTKELAKKLNLKDDDKYIYYGDIYHYGCDKRYKNKMKSQLVTIATAVGLSTIVGLCLDID